SSISSKSAASKILKARRLRMAVTNQVQQGSGMRSHFIPGARWFTVVVTKLIALITVPRQNRPMLTSQRSVPAPCPGPAAAIALRGVYCVQPATEAPPGTKNAETSTKKETSVVQKPSMFSHGNAISEVPSSSGKKYVPNPLCGTVDKTKNTINVP